MPSEAEGRRGSKRDRDNEANKKATDADQKKKRSGRKEKGGASNTRGEKRFTQK